MTDSSGGNFIEPYTGHLDYAGAKLQMRVTNQVEHSWRVNAAGKEPWTVEFIESIPAGGWFWDIGANVGPYTLIAAHRGLGVVAIEPHYRTTCALKDNLALNGMLERAIVVQAALAHQSGYEWFHLKDLRPGTTGHVLGGGKKVSFHRDLIRVLRLDDLFEEIAAVVPDLPKAQHYLKIDVDGAEQGVLRGANSLLEGDSCVAGIMLEMELAQEKQTTELLASFGWRLVQRFDHRGEARIGGICYGRFERAG